MPGEVIVAPRSRAEEVAKYAKKILDEDKAGAASFRRNLACLRMIQ